MNMHQVTPESIRKLRASLKLHEYKNLEDIVDESSDSEVLDIASELFIMQRDNLEFRS